MARVLVTGGLGAVGSHLVKELRARGHEVWLCDLPHHYDRQYVRCDVGEFRQVEGLFRGRRFDYVYHLAAEFGRQNGEDYYENLWRTNAIGTKNMIRMQEREGFRMIFFSSSEVYGDYSEVMHEDVMDKYEIRQMNDYAMTKWVGEMQILNSATLFKTETVRVRLFNTYGPGELYSPYRSVICLFAYCALHDLPYTVFLNHHRTSSYVTDTMRTLANIADRFRPGEVFNIGGTQYHDIKYLSDLILRHLGKDDRLVVYKEAQVQTTRDKQVDLSKAIEHLDHRPQVSLEEGIPLTVDWMRRVYTGEEGVRLLTVL